MKMPQDEEGLLLVLVLVIAIGWTNANGSEIVPDGERDDDSTNVFFFFLQWRTALLT